MKKYFTKKNIIIASLLFILLSASFFIKLPNNDEEILKIPNESVTIAKSDTTSSTLDYFYVDVKGSIKKPGVYKFTEGQMIIDAISAAGGLDKNASTNNINLSKKLTNEMVIYIYTKSELKEKSLSNCPIQVLPECKCETIEIKNCVEEMPVIEQKPVTEESESDHEETITPTASEEQKLININLASSAELETLPGIGVSKSTAIIEYRKITKFNSIEEIKNVSGIGDALFSSIKDLITI